MAHSTCSTTELHVQEQQKHNTGCATDVKYSKSHNEASLAKVILGVSYASSLHIKLVLYLDYTCTLTTPSYLKPDSWYDKKMEP